jgi:endoglucanase
VATQYGKKPHVIYEIFNEPTKESWKDVVKPYAEAVISEIRAIDKDSLILVGVPQYCQRIQDAAKNPLDAENVAYTVHFYAATHKLRLRKNTAKALEKGIAVFISEYGTCEYTGNGKFDAEESKKWFAFMDEHKLSSCNWSLFDKKETASALMPGASTKGNWAEKDLTPSGKLIRERLRTRKP